MLYILYFEDDIFQMFTAAAMTGIDRSIKISNFFTHFDFNLFYCSSDVFFQSWNGSRFVGINLTCEIAPQKSLMVLSRKI